MDVDKFHRPVYAVRAAGLELELVNANIITYNL